MTAAMPLHIPRTGYALTMGATTLAGLAVAACVALASGGDARTAALAAAALAVASLATAAPAAMSISADYWGVAVLFSGVARGLLVLAITFIMSRAGVEGRPLFTGAVSGAVLILMLETIVAIRVLARLERRRDELKNHGASRC